MATIRIKRPLRGASAGNPNPYHYPARELPDPPERVGYGNPPKQHRWQKGESGNPLGRPRSGNFWADLRRELDRPVFVMEGGKRRRRNYQQILLRKMVHQAVKGDSRQLENILKSMLRIEEPMDPDFPKGKARDYLHKLMCDVITKQRKLGYSERVAEEAEERDSANSKGDDEDES